jgi:hypothetical protein
MQIGSNFSVGLFCYFVESLKLGMRVKIMLSFNIVHCAKRLIEDQDRRHREGLVLEKEGFGLTHIHVP